MLRMAANSDKGPIAILGLSRENIRRLQNDEPISVDLSTLGLPHVHVMIFAGEDEDSMRQSLEELIGPATDVQDRR